MKYKLPKIKTTVVFNSSNCVRFDCGTQRCNSCPFNNKSNYEDFRKEIEDLKKELKDLKTKNENNA